MSGLSRTQLDEVGILLGGRVSGVVPMAGATSSDLYRLETADADAVLRIFRTERWVEAASKLSARESKILEALATSGIAAPRPLGILSDNGVLMSWLPGRVDLPRHPDRHWLDQLARTLADVHGLPLTVPYRYESWNDTEAGEPPRWWRDPQLWSEVQSSSIRLPRFEPRFIHRDYHPVNVLWENGRISGIVDWINACMGPVGIDVAHCRLNLALMYGLAAAADFLDFYRLAAPDYRHHPFWDLEDALGALPDVEPYPPWAEFGLTGLTAGIVQARLETFVAAAVGDLQSSASL